MWSHHWRTVVPGGATGRVARYAWPSCLVGLALATRLPLLSISLDEVDSANFVNALVNGYDIPLLRPHPPGFPVYVFLGSVAHRLVDDPVRALAWLSAVLGSLMLIPFYLLLRDLLGHTWALVGSVFLVVNPLVWSFSESALSDVPAMFFTTTLAWLCYRGRTSPRALFGACVVASLTIGVRQQNAALLVLLVVPLAERLIERRQVPWRLLTVSGCIFLLTTAAWVLPMVAYGSEGWPSYAAAVERQWATTVNIYDVTQVASPWLPNVLLRVERFLTGYLFMYAWTGDDTKNAASLLLVAPWVFGFALFIVGFRIRQASHLFTALWLSTLGATTLGIHFLPRYGLVQVPAFVIACMIGYAFLIAVARAHPRRVELVLSVGIACVCILYGLKYQPPVVAFEATPPAGSVAGAALVAAGLLQLLVVRAVFRPGAGWSWNGVAPSWSWTSRPSFGQSAMVLGMLAVLLVFGVRGWRIASVAHTSRSPNQRIVEFAKAHFDADRVTPCWDNQTHSTFEVLMPPAQPTGFWSIHNLYDAVESGHVLLVTDKCEWWNELDLTLDLEQVARFEGSSPLWVKAPEMRLYATASSSSGSGQP